MQVTETGLQIEFAGSPEERDVALRIFTVLRSVGRFYALTAPIRLPLHVLAEHFARLDAVYRVEAWAAEIERVARMNEAVFLLEEQDGTLFVATTREGKAPCQPVALDTVHTLPKRFQDPPAVAPRVVRRPAEAVPSTPQPVASAQEVEPTAPATPDLVPEAETRPVVQLDWAGLRQLDDQALQEVVANELASDPEVAGFADRWMLEEAVPRLSRGDLRRIREYIEERQQPLQDTELVEVVLGIRGTAAQFDLYRFAVDVRLSQDGEFEFFGVPGKYLWSVKGFSPVGPTKRRPADIGQDYRFLIEEARTATPLSEPIVDHVLTFYEHSLGVLPYNAAFAAVLPPPVLADQRIALLTFESTQTYETFHVELRYPYGNRGGYLAGFERFFEQHLVPGALVTIERTENPGHYTIDYLPMSVQERKLLAFDEKKRRYFFRPTTFSCAVQENMLLAENRFPRFAGQEALDDRTRRYPDQVLAKTFERVGEQIGTPDGPRYMALLDDLLAAANIERPMTVELIRQIAESPDYPQFSVDPDAEDVLYYAPVV
jgi:hypothetical protein